MTHALAATLLIAAGCAARPAAPPAAPAEATQAPTDPGVAESQSPPPREGDFVFVDKERKEPATHEDDPPVTNLRADPSARKRPETK